MRLRTLTIADFQAHKNLTIEFGRITTLVGPTDVGKSAILRALRWVCLNDLTGEDFIRTGAKQATVDLHVASKKQAHTIVRQRGRENLYSLNGEEFKAFGANNVPQDIAALLRVNEVNFQAQFDGPFWFQESAPEVSRRLNVVVDLSMIDTALSEVASRVRQAQMLESMTKERLAAAQEEVQQLAKQEERIAQFDQLKHLEDKRRQTAKAHSRLAGVLEQLGIGQEQAQCFDLQAVEAEELFGLAKKALRASRQQERLQELLDEFKSYQAVEQDLAKVEKEYHKQIKGQTCPLCDQLIK